MALTPDSKSKLSTTIRTLRTDLLRDIEDHVTGVYRLAVPVGQAGLSESDAVRRGRLEAWLDEQTRGAGGKAARDRFLKQAVKEAAATLLNRLVFLRLLEQTRGPDGRPLRRTQIISGGWSSKGYLEFRDYAGALLDDGSEGYVSLLELVYDDLAVDLPGLYGSVGITDLIPIPTTSLRTVVEALNQRELDEAWDDDTTLGWTYQYWNDPERYKLDAKVKAGGKIEPHEIAAKTQMFTERYMVEWLLHNSLGPTWFAICRRHGWRAEAEDVLPVLESRRADWLVKREAEAVAVDALMPMESPLEDRWKYYVLQDIPEEAVAAAPESLRDLKMLDPACGSGHFLVIACGLLFELYREEARHRGEDGEDAWSDKAIVSSILENNLHGIDIDPRAVQIAAAALWLKARTLAVGVRPRRLNLVAPAFNLANLPDDDPALKTLLREVWRETGLPEELTKGIVKSLAGADHLGTLLKVDKAVAEAVLSHKEATGAFEAEPTFDHWVAGGAKTSPALVPTPDALILEKLEAFLERHTGGRDLGLRLDGEQLTAGVRFIRMVQEGTYHIVVGNPPYLGTKSLGPRSYIDRNYPSSKGDLYACFWVRIMGMVSYGGIGAMVTRSNWMFLSQMEALRTHIISNYSLSVIGDLGSGAFEEITGEIVIVAMATIRNICLQHNYEIKAVSTLDFSNKAVSCLSKAPALISQEFSYTINISAVREVPTNPFIYWWDSDVRQQYITTPLLGSIAPAKQGLATGDDARFLRRPWEILLHPHDLIKNQIYRWAPFVKGAEDKMWMEPLDEAILWHHNGYELKVKHEARYGSYTKRVAGERHYFKTGVAFSRIGQTFRARLHRARSVIGDKGSSVFTNNIATILCMLNSSKARYILESLNPGLGFEVGDVNRLPVFSINNADDIYAKLDADFTMHESVRENSVEFRCPGPSSWRYAQDWAQRAVDRPAGKPLPEWEPEYDAPSAASYVSFALGIALGRFSADGNGILDVAPTTALSHGLLLLSSNKCSRSQPRPNGLDHSACTALRSAWIQYGGVVKRGCELEEWMRLDFFKHHKALYENRPIWLPLSSAKRNFVIYAAIHRWNEGTLDEVRVLLKDERKVLDGELEDVKLARAAGDAKARGNGEKRQEELRVLLAELDGFSAKVEAIAEQGAPPAPGGKPRHADARFVMDLDDGVMVNSAALWPLLDPQWKDPVKWWKELCDPKGRKDYDWSHLAARYFPSRVDGKCKDDPSIAVAHGCFWRYHPARAYAWELRLQDEIGPDFLIKESDSDAARTRFLVEQPEIALEIEQKEQRRRERKALKAEADEEGDDAESGDAEETEEACP